MEGSTRHSPLPGHYALGVVELQGDRIIIGGVYGDSANNDTASAAVLQAMTNHITELKYLFNTANILLAGDFNVVYRNEDTTSFHNRKPRTATLLEAIMRHHGLQDLGLTSGNVEHTWHRTHNNLQSSRLDLILTSMKTTNLKLQVLPTTFDHSNVSAAFGHQPSRTKPGQKDYILGSEEFIYRVIDAIDDILGREATLSNARRRENTLEEEGSQIADQEENNLQHTIEERHNLPMDSPETPETILLNTIISQATRIHDIMIRKHNAINKLEVEEFGKRLKGAHNRILQEPPGETRAAAQQQYDDLQRELQQRIEAKDVASQERISNFYKTNTGKILPTTFVPIKEVKSDRYIHQIRQGEQITNNEEEIVDIMQKWYEETAQQQVEQTLTLSDFLEQRNIELPTLTEEQRNMLEEEISQEELTWALTKAKEASAPGPSGQTISLYKLLNMLIPGILTKAVNQIAFVPQLLSHPQLQWIQERKVIWIPKKPSPMEPSDYRPLSMLEVLYKLPSRILARRLNNVLPDIVSRNQHGFIQGKGIQEPSITVTHILQEADLHGRPLQLASFDIEKAFDRVGHLVIMQSLQQFGIPTITVEAIQRLALTGRFQVEVNGKLGQMKEIRTGSGQGDPLSSVLFNIATEPMNRAIAAGTISLAYKTIENRAIGPIIYADDNINPLSLTRGEQINDIVEIYRQYKEVSGLNVNISKTSVLCINTPAPIVETLQQLGFKTPTTLKHLGITLGRNMAETIQQTMEGIDAKAMRRRILGTTPPTDMLHKATLVNMAYIPLYNHVFMALPLQENHVQEVQNGIQQFMWTKQKNSITLQKRRLVSKTRVHASHVMGGLQIPLVKDTLQGLHMNLLQKMYKLHLQDPENLLHHLLTDLLYRTNRPTLSTHLKAYGPLGWEKTARNLQTHNLMFSQAFQAVGSLLRDMETSRSHWHLSAIYGHSLSPSPHLTEAENITLQDAGIHTVSQLFVCGDSGTITREYDLTINIRLARQPFLSHKLKRLAEAITKKALPTLNIRPHHNTNAELLFPLQNLSKIQRKQKRDTTDNQIEIAPAYNTRIRDGVYVPDRKTFLDSYKIVDASFIPSKTKELAFQVLNRTLWTNNKAFKSGMRDSPDCKFCGQIETQEHLLFQCEHYSSKLWDELGRVLTTALAQLNNEYVPRVQFTPAHIVFNKQHPSIMLHVKDPIGIKILILLVQETKREIYFRNQTTPHLRPIPVHRTRILAHLLSITKKLKQLLLYQGMKEDTVGLQLLALLDGALVDSVA